VIGLIEEIAAGIETRVRRALHNNGIPGGMVKFRAERLSGGRAGGRWESRLVEVLMIQARPSHVTLGGRKEVGRARLRKGYFEFGVEAPVKKRFRDETEPVGAIVDADRATIARSAKNGGRDCASQNARTMNPSYNARSHP